VRDIYLVVSFIVCIVYVAICQLF